MDVNRVSAGEGFKTKIEKGVEGVRGRGGGRGCLEGGGVVGRGWLALV